MKKIHRVMACIDLSEFSKETIDYAVTLTKGSMIEIVLFNVINSRDVQAVETASRFYPQMINTERFVEAAKADRYKQIDELIEEHFPADRVKMKILIGVGTPFEEILKAIDTEEIDLVFIANKGRTNLARTLFGSNAEKVFRHSPVPVLSIRDRERFHRNK